MWFHESVSGSAPRLAGVYETVLYAADVEATARFYADVLGLQLLEQPSELMAALRLPDAGVLLIFDPTRAAAPDRDVPSHGSHGAGHVAFAVELGRLDEWADEIRRRGVQIEQDVAWAEGGRSVYVRDPAGNSVELVEGEIWPLAPRKTEG